jgi:hypothetical protein
MLNVLGLIKLSIQYNIHDENLGKWVLMFFGSMKLKKIHFIAFTERSNRRNRDITLTV